MAWRLVIQPNGLYARFSEVVDDFTDCHMSEKEAEQLCMFEYGLSKKEARDKIQAAINAKETRYTECLNTIERVHGSKVKSELVKEIENE